MFRSGTASNPFLASDMGKGCYI
ncbi:hypothetical protein F383_26370 [Gossypium arboreum]|uniref:Uncharacterized protein n=1 Tax=Gossypium arboreum TaxID=29729 RepID=A0A0B0P4K9_GOSAR|nr:hypothetical protein F383_26370 [Gossypium arboreum]